MKKLIIFSVIVLFPLLNYSQTEVKLKVHQLPDLGFTLIDSDTTITNGQTLSSAENVLVYGGTGSYTHSWSPNSGINNVNVANPVLSPEKTTLYRHTITDGNGCNFTVSYLVIVDDEGNSLNKNINPTKLNTDFFPNPASNYINLNITGAVSKLLKISIVDNSGKYLKTCLVENFTGSYSKQLELNLPVGVYNLVVESEGVKIEEKLIISK